ncbi:10025_t:CDS:2, partial [Dentiscutata heterogama]
FRVLETTLKKLPSPAGGIFYFGNYWQVGPEPHKNIQMGQQCWIILTGDKVVGDLLQKHMYSGGKYSSRPPNYYFYQILTKFQLASLNIITILCLAKSIKDVEDPFYKEFEIFMKNRLELIKVTGRLSDFFPILRWFSINKKYNQVIEDRKIAKALYGRLIEEVKNDSENKPCFVRSLLRKVDKVMLDELDIIYLMSDIFSAGTDTVSSSLTWITDALANNPQVQHKAHQELDQVIGHFRLPSASDEPNLPYIRVIIKEGQRYCGPVYLGVSHYIEEDDQYNGYHIPRLTICLIEKSPLQTAVPWLHFENPETVLMNDIEQKIEVML